MENLTEYKELMNNTSLQETYRYLLKLLSEIKNSFPAAYNTGNISPGYLDYSYFPFFDEYLRKHKLRFGIVLNHKEMTMELWLMGQNAAVQKQYWEVFKNTKWNKDRTEMPQYSVLSVTLCPVKETMDINDVIHLAVQTSQEIEEFLCKKS